MESRRGEVVLCNALLAILEKKKKKQLKSDHEVSASCQKKTWLFGQRLLEKVKINYMEFFRVTDLKCLGNKWKVR